MDDAAPLTRDPVFQLNSCLWLVRRAPLDRAVAPPVYLAAGFTLRALNFKMSVPPILSNVLTEKLGLPRGSPEPDVVLRHNKSGDHLVLECKASSFGVASTTANQGYKLLAACAEPSRSIGATGSAGVVYVLHHEDVAPQLETLDELSCILTDNSILHAQYGTLGLSIEGDGLWADLYLIDLAKNSTFAAVAGRKLVHEEAGGDSRPLYFIPYDPASIGQQSPDERDYCATQLSQRIINCAISRIGRSPVPETVRLNADELLKEVTYNVSDHWDGRDKATLRVTITSKLYGYLHRRGFKDKVASRRGSYVEIALGDEDDRRTALDLLQTSDEKRLSRDILKLPLALECEPDEAGP